MSKSTMTNEYMMESSLRLQRKWGHHKDPAIRNHLAKFQNQRWQNFSRFLLAGIIKKEGLK